MSDGSVIYGDLYIRSVAQYTCDINYIVVESAEPVNNVTVTCDLSASNVTAMWTYIPTCKRKSFDHAHPEKINCIKVMKS